MDMTGCPVLAASFVMKIVGVFFVLSSLALVLVILVQKGRGGGLSSAFGGSVASGILGSKTGDFLTWVTIGVVAVLLVLALILDRWNRPGVRSDYDVPATTAPADVNGAVDINQTLPTGMPRAESRGDMNQPVGTDAPLD
jgi:preprotein translocase subunit SecG